MQFISHCSPDLYNLIWLLTNQKRLNSAKFQKVYDTIFWKFPVKASTHGGQDMKNSLSEPYTKVRHLTSNLLKVLFSKFLILSTGLMRRRSPEKIADRWRYRLPIKNLTPHYNSQFCVSILFFVLLMKPAYICKHV